MILSMKVLLLGAAVTTATATATAQGTTRTTGTERTVHAGDYVTSITVDGTPTTITDDVKSVTAAPGAKVKVTAAPPQRGKRARLVITKAASSTSGQTQSGSVTKIEVKGEGEKTTINVGMDLQMVATVEGTEGIDKSVIWEVCPNEDGATPEYSSTNCACIDQDGVLTGLYAGSIRVFATSKEDDTKRSYCIIDVVNSIPGIDSGSGAISIPEVWGVTVTGKDGKATVVKGETLQMLRTVNGTNGITQAVSWSVYDIVNGAVRTDFTSTCASINESGLLKGKEFGNVRVIAQSKYDTNYEGYCDIEVKDGTGQPQTGENGGGQGAGEVTPVVNPGGQGTGQDTPGGQGEEQLSSKIGTEHDHYLVINFPAGKEKLKLRETITLSATDISPLFDVSWSTNPSYATLSAASALNSIKFSCDVPGTVRVTATLMEDPDVTAYQDFEVVDE